MGLRTAPEPLAQSPVAFDKAMQRPTLFPCFRLAPSEPVTARTSAWSHRWPLLLVSTAALFADEIEAASTLLFLLLLLGACAAAGAWALRRRAAHSAQGAAGASCYPAQLRAGTPQELWASHRAGLYERGDALAVRAAAGAKPSTLVMFEQLDLPELHAVFGARAGRRLAASFERKLTALAGEKGTALRTGPTCWAVLLPSHDADGALAAVREALGTGMAVEAEAADDELLLVPRVAMRTFHDDATPMRTVYQELRERIVRVHAQELRREEYLRRERESHTRPSGLDLARRGATTT